MADQKRVLVLCTGNSCRSQMAEGWINHRLAGQWQARSAGTEPVPAVHPLAIQVMAEIGIDISAGRPEPVTAFLGEPWDLVVTVCDSAQETCPVFPHPVETLHISFPDPARADGSEAEQLEQFREVRNAIRDQLLPALQDQAHQ
jgi:arsenate reductase